MTTKSDGDSGAIAMIRATTGGGVMSAWLVLILTLSGPPALSFLTTIVAPLGSSIAHHFGGGDRGALIAQLSITLPAIGVMLGGPLLAPAIKWLGYRRVVVASAVLMTLTGALCAVIDNIILFLAARFVVGLSGVALYSSLVALSGVLFSGVTLGRMISYQNGLSALSGMGLVLLSGFVASQFGWRVSFWLYFGLSVFAILALIAWLPEKVTLKGQPRRGTVSLRPLLSIYLITIGVFAVVFMVIVQGSLLMSANGIEDPSAQSFVIAASTIAYAITATACSWIETNITKNWTFTASLVLLAAGLSTMGAIPAVWGATLGSLLLGAGSGLSASYLTKIVIERAPEGARERAVGFIAPTHYLGQFANPFIMQSLRMTVGIQGAFILIGLVLCVAALATILIQARAARSVVVES